MRKFIRLAWRNIWRNRRRSLITISAIAFAILMVALTRSLQYGTYDTMESLAVSLYHGELQVQREGFHEEQTLTYFLNSNEIDWNRYLEKYPLLTEYSRRVTGFGLVSSDSGSAGALIVGIEPDMEVEITQFSSMVTTGNRIAAGDEHCVMLGETLAKNLNVAIDDTVVVLTQGYRNQLGADTYIVKGLLTIGQTELERAIMIMPLHDAQQLFSLQNRITQVVFKTRDFREAPALSQKISSQLNDDERYDVLSWEELMPELKQIIVIDNVSGAIYLAFILIVVGMEIFNATMMSIVERSKEFGILQSIGMKPTQISALISVESTFKLILGLLAGVLISVIAVYIISRFSIPLPEEMLEAYANYGFSLDSLRFSTRLKVFTEPVIAMLIIGALSLIFPIIKTSRLSPLEAFRKA